MAIKLTCYQCGNPKFGLVRQRARGHVFCTIKCLEAYTEGAKRLQQDIRILAFLRDLRQMDNA